MANSNRVSIVEAVQPKTTKNNVKGDFGFLKTSKSQGKIKKSPVEPQVKGLRGPNAMKDPKSALNVIEEKIEPQNSMPTDPNLSPRSKIVTKLQKRIKLNFLQTGTAPQT